MAYQFYVSGTQSTIAGRLVADIVIETKGDKRTAKIKIAANAGSKKNEAGDYENIVDYYDITVWDNGGASTEFLDAIEKPPSEKLVFKKGNNVVFYGMITNGVREYEGKGYKDTKVNHFFHLAKVLPNVAKQQEDTSSGGY
jgi:hypothetical protein